jgi:hypothetical protein
MRNSLHKWACFLSLLVPASAFFGKKTCDFNTYFYTKKDKVIGKTTEIDIDGKLGGRMAFYACDHGLSADIIAVDEPQLESSTMYAVQTYYLDSTFGDCLASSAQKKAMSDACTKASGKLWDKRPYTLDELKKKARWAWFEDFLVDKNTVNERYLKKFKKVDYDGNISEFDGKNFHSKD